MKKSVAALLPSHEESKGEPINPKKMSTRVERSKQGSKITKGGMILE